MFMGNTRDFLYFLSTQEKVKERLHAVTEKKLVNWWYDPFLPLYKFQNICSCRI